jgi:hypothetical protein
MLNKVFPLLRSPDSNLAETVSMLDSRQRVSRRAVLRGLVGAGAGAALASPLASLAATCGVIPSEPLRDPIRAVYGLGYKYEP